MQKIFNNKVMAILGLITSIYVIAFLILLIFATMTLLSVATLFNVFMWISIVASVLVIVGLLYTKFGEKCNWTKKGIILLIAQAVSLGVLLAKGVEIMNMFTKFSALYNNLKQYGGSELNSAGNSVGSLASLLLNDAGAMTFILLLAISSIIILVISIMLLGKGTVANVATVENIPPSISDADKAEDVAAKTAADVKENSEIKEGVSAEKVEKIDEKRD